MKTYDNPDKVLWNEISMRPQLELGFLESTVRNILKRVKDSGDIAIRDLTHQFDKVNLQAIEVTPEEIEEANRTVDERLKHSIEKAAENIRKFHAAQTTKSAVIETMPGVKCWRRSAPIEKVGIYIPGGSAPLLSTVLMLGVPATLAGCKEIILCTPTNSAGKIDSGILFAAKLVGVTRIFKVGGAQAIAALAYGTETIPKVYKIFGPGNQYVTKAKQLVAEESVAIDIPAGPSEVLVLADESADPGFVASDLLSQAEHGEDSQVVLVLLNKSLVPEIQAELARQLETLPRKSIAQKSIANSRIIFFSTVASAMEFVNDYAPEHLIINTANAFEIAHRVNNAGSVFIGNYTPEAAGDYASGTNHTLPTNGYAKSYSGVSLESFTKQITFQQITESGLKNLGPVVQIMAEAENLIGHKRAIDLRLEKLENKS
jgi:histidinol dehydrogenase